MEKNKVTLRRQLHGWLPLLLTCGIVLVAYSILAATVFRYQINPDGISYIHIAQRYAAFDIPSALNGYWGPLLSWVLVPFIWIGAKPIVSIYIISVLASIGLVLSLHQFARAKLTSIRPLPLYLIETTLLLILASFSLSVLTPDILLSFTFFIVFLAFVRFNDRPTTKNAILLGGSGALVYFAKPIGLPLFLFMLAAYAVYFFIQKRSDRRILLIPLAAFLILSLPYITALSVKYHRFTFSTSSTYNLSLISPTNRRVHTITQPGIYLPKAHYSSVWDDPSYLPTKEWNPLKSPGDMVYYANEVLTNVHDITTYATDLGMAFLLGLACIVAAAIMVKKLRFEALVAVTLTVGLFGLYALSVVEPRHLWPLIAFAFLGILFMTDHLAERNGKLPQLTTFIALGAALLSFSLLLPINTGAVTPPYYNLSMGLKKNLPEGSRVASDSADLIYVCYTLNVKCVGILPANAKQGTIDYLRMHNVRYLQLNDPTQYKMLLHKYYQTVDPTLHLYMLK